MAIASHNKKNLQTIIEETVMSNKHRTISDALRLASSILQQSKNSNKKPAS